MGELARIEIYLMQTEQGIQCINRSHMTVQPDGMDKVVIAHLIVKELERILSAGIVITENPSKL